MTTLRNKAHKWWWENVVKTRAPDLYRKSQLEEAANNCIRLLSTIIPPNDKDDMINWVVQSGDTEKTHYVAAYMELCEVMGKDLKEYHGTKGHPSE